LKYIFNMTDDYDKFILNAGPITDEMYSSFNYKIHPKLIDMKYEIPHKLVHEYFPDSPNIYKQCCVDHVMNCIIKYPMKHTYNIFKRFIEAKLSLYNLYFYIIHPKITELLMSYQRITNPLS